MKLKWSKYNFLSKGSDNNYVLYNSYTNNLMEIDESDFPTIERLRNNNFHGIDDEFMQELLDESILVEDDDLIYQKVKLSRLNTRFRSDIVHLTIVPTMACNFSCPYCFENDVQTRRTMDRDTQNEVINYIKSLKNLRYLSIDWYGGEPLIAFDVIVYLMKKIKELNIESFFSSIVTNGYLLNKKIINQLKELGITRMQVTIDGLENTHNQRRPHKVNTDSFKKIIDNLILINILYPELEVHIRVNIDKNNANEFFEVSKYISNVVKGTNIYTYPAYVTDYSSCNSSFCLLGREEQAEFALSNADKYPFERFYYPRTRVNECTARFANSFVIGPEGELYRCWCDAGNKDKKCGTLKDGVTNTDIYTKYMMLEDPLFDEKCKTCSYFPICNGGCVLRRINNHGNEDGSLCTIQKEQMQKFIKLYHEKTCKVNH